MLLTIYHRCDVFSNGNTLQNICKVKGSSQRFFFLRVYLSIETSMQCHDTEVISPSQAAIDVCAQLHSSAWNAFALTRHSHASLA
jgi:hypothetical protein